MPRRELRNAVDVRRYIAYIMRKLESGKLDPAIAGKLGFLANTLLKAIELGIVEERLKQLESEIIKVESGHNVIDLPVRTIEGERDEQI